MVALTGGLCVSVMAITAVISVLGVPGWGTLHLALEDGGPPASLLPLLQQAWRQGRTSGEGRPIPALLLTALLRGQTDLQPLAPQALVGLQGPLVRHRLVCRRDRSVFTWRAWLLPPGHARWLPCLGPLPLEASLLDGERPDPEAGVLPAPSPRPAASPGCLCLRLAPSIPASIAAAPLPPSDHRHGAPDRVAAAARGL